MTYFFTYSFFDTKIRSNLTQKKVAKLVEFNIKEKEFPKNSQLFFVEKW
jgi:hypothetical protein